MYTSYLFVRKKKLFSKVVCEEFQNVEVVCGYIKLGNCWSKWFPTISTIRPPHIGKIDNFFFLFFINKINTIYPYLPIHGYNIPVNWSLFIFHFSPTW